MSTEGANLYAKAVLATSRETVFDVQIKDKHTAELVQEAFADHGCLVLRRPFDNILTVCRTQTASGLLKSS